jgi:uncharacterized protein YkwD
MDKTGTAAEDHAHERTAGSLTTRTRHTRRTRRIWFVGAALAVAIAATACLPPGATSHTDHDGMVSVINASRAANGLGAVSVDSQLDTMAQNWAQQLAANGQLSHQNLAAIIGSPYMAGWQRLTENLFQGSPSSTNAFVENAWMASSAHRANILDPNVNRVGVGVAHDGSGTTYVVADFGLR